MVGPGDERARSHLRAGHADRERVIEVLKAAFVQGRLERDELDLRVGRAFASRTYADLHALTRDLPVRPAAQPLGPAREPDTGAAPRPDHSKAVRAWACATVALPSTAVGLALLGSGVTIQLSLISLLMFVCVVTGPVMTLVLLHSWVEKHSGGKSSPQSPARPGGDEPFSNAIPVDEAGWPHHVFPAPAAGAGRSEFR